MRRCRVTSERLQLKPDNDFWSGKWFYVTLGCCDWDNVDKHKDEVLNGIIKNKKDDVSRM
jgi:hypothetical protein